MGCGGGSTRRPARTPPPAQAPARTPPEGSGPSLAVGITEQNPNFVWAPPHSVPGPFARWRDALGRLHPALYRLVIDWSALQPNAGERPNFDLPNGGCLRDKPPCGAYGGVRDQLRALASRQREGGWQALVVFTGTPAWAARKAAGCERDTALPRSRAPRADALPEYRAFVADVLKVAAQEKARLTYFSAWNEPNQIFGLSPQRARCDGGAPSVSVARYAELVRSLQQVLDSAPGDQQIVLGELAALPKRRPLTTAVREFVSELPQDVACASPIWSQHGYLGGNDPVGIALPALDRKGCPQRHVVWLTETGVGAPHRGEHRSRSPRAQLAACHNLHDALAGWYREPRVTAAFQYTLREDDVFPTGLVSTDLTRAYPALAEWTAWGMGRRPRPTDPPPQDSC